MSIDRGRVGEDHKLQIHFFGGGHSISDDAGSNGEGHGDPAQAVTSINVCIISDYPGNQLRSRDHGQSAACRPLAPPRQRACEREPPESANYEQISHGEAALQPVARTQRRQHHSPFCPRPGTSSRLSFSFVCSVSLFNRAKFTCFIEMTGTGCACSKTHPFEVLVVVFEQCVYELSCDAKATVARVNINVSQAPDMILLCIGVTISSHRRR